MKQFEYGDQIETTMGNATFVEYSNGGSTYKVEFIDGPNAGTQLSLGDRAILSEGKNNRIGGKVVLGSKYAPYEGNEELFNSPVDFKKEGFEEFLKKANSWVLVVSCCKKDVDVVSGELTKAGLENATDYIHVRKGRKQGGPKYDVLIPDPEIPDIDLQLGLFFNPFRKGVYQIARKDFALPLVKNIRVLEVGEKYKMGEVIR